MYGGIYVKKLLSLLILTFIIPLMCACSTDTHYDSVSTEITLDVPDLPYDGSSITVHQRFQFDRDLAPLTSMSLVEAWLTSPAIDTDWSDEENRQDDSFSLDIVQSINISLVESEDSQPIFWMLIPSAQLHGTEALFNDFNVGDLRQYIDDYQQLELEIEIRLEPYHIMRYWRDVCKMSKDCTIQLPLSMQFKMED